MELVVGGHVRRALGHDLGPSRPAAQLVLHAAAGDGEQPSTEVVRSAREPVQVADRIEPRVARPGPQPRQEGGHAGSAGAVVARTGRAPRVRPCRLRVLDRARPDPEPQDGPCADHRMGIGRRTAGDRASTPTRTSPNAEHSSPGSGDVGTLGAPLTAETGRSCPALPSRTVPGDSASLTAEVGPTVAARAGTRIPRTGGTEGCDGSCPDGPPLAHVAGCTSATTGTTSSSRRQPHAAPAAVGAVHRVEEVSGHAGGPRRWSASPLSLVRRRVRSGSSITAWASRGRARASARLQPRRRVVPGTPPLADWIVGRQAHRLRRA